MPYRLEVVERSSTRVGADETDVFVLRTRMRGIESRTHVLADGTVLRTEVPLGGITVAMRREDERTAKALSRTGVADLALRLSVPAPWPAGAPGPRAARRTVVAVGGIDPLDGMAGGVQRVSRTDTGEFLLTVDLDAAAREKAGPGALEPTIFVQSDAPRIVEAARAAVEGVPAAPPARAAALARWVFRRIQKGAAFTLPSALDVLENPRGDCNEHAVLYAALARALGIPTRIAAGLVYLPSDGGRFYYHAWNEVHIDGAWRPVDPTFDQAEADAARIRLVVGELDEQVRIATVAGRITTRILEAR
jgi:transglutaminase-like putative cysteine protease